MLFRQFRGLGTVADGGLQALGIHGTSHLRGERRRAPKIARLRNTPPTAVQHDEMSGRPTFLPTGSPCASRERRCYTSLLSSRPTGTRNVPSASPQQSADSSARLMLVAVSLAWGLSWPAMKIALNEIPPFSMRVGTSGLATATLFALAFMQRRNIRVHSGLAWAHLVVAGCLNIACFTLFAAFAQLATATSRVAILTYTMPIWAALLAYPILGERLNFSRGISLLLCIIGLTVLAYPLIGSSDLIGLVLALATAVSWAAGTVYLKWAQIDADPMAVVVWQLVVGLLVTIAGLFRSRRFRLRLSALVRDRPQAAGDGRIARRAERPGRGHRGLGAGPGRAADHRRHCRVSLHLDCRRRRAARAHCAIITACSDRAVIWLVRPSRSVNAVDLPPPAVRGRRPHLRRSMRVRTLRPADARSSHRDRRNGRAAATLDFQRLHDEGKLVDSLGREFVELEIFEQMHAIHHQRDLMYGQRNLRIRVGRNLDRPVIGAEQHGIFGNQPLGSLNANSRT